jgi:hypothetical protein
VIRTNHSLAREFRLETEHSITQSVELKQQLLLDLKKANRQMTLNPLIQQLLNQQHQLLEDQSLRQSLQEVNP